ncbi:MAG: hypothetical protein ABFS86_02395 [Planctomycetota bacterium]
MIHIPENPPREPAGDPDDVCPACGEAVRNGKRKVVCRSDVCTWSVIRN